MAPHAQVSATTARVRGARCGLQRRGIATIVGCTLTERSLLRRLAGLRPGGARPSTAVDAVGRLVGLDCRSARHAVEPPCGSAAGARRRDQPRVPCSARRWLAGGAEALQAGCCRRPRGRGPVAGGWFVRSEAARVRHRPRCPPVGSCRRDEAVERRERPRASGRCRSRHPAAVVAPGTATQFDPNAAGDQRRPSSSALRPQAMARSPHPWARCRAGTGGTHRAARRSSAAAHRPAPGQRADGSPWWVAGDRSATVDRATGARSGAADQGCASRVAVAGPHAAGSAGRTCGRRPEEAARSILARGLVVGSWSIEEGFADWGWRHIDAVLRTVS